MSVYGVNNPLTANLASVGRPMTPAGAPRPGAPGAGAVRPGARPATPAPAGLKPQAPLAAPSTALQAEAPAGTDPELWGVLTAEERTYFAKVSSMGPLTYGRIAAGINGNALAQGTPASLGGRLDVRG